jgi:hypothetical protein
MHPETRARLEQRFAAPNEALRSLTGIAWPTRDRSAAPAPADIDLASPHLLADPYPAYEALRAHGPVVYLPRQGFWIVLGHAEATFALSRPDLFSSAPYQPFDPVLAGADPPLHGPARAALHRALRAELVDAAVRSASEATASQRAPRFDAFRDVAAPAARAAAATLTGIAPAALAAIPRAPGVPVGELIAALDRVAGEARLTATLTADPAGALEPAQARIVVRSLWLATATTLERLLAHALLRLASDPELQRTLAADAAARTSFADEVARLHPTEHMISRIAVSALTFAGQAMAAGERVEICVSAANRDPAMFEDAASFRASRPAHPHLSFGHGPHACLGAKLGRRVVADVVASVLGGTASLRPASPPDEPEFVRTVRSITLRSVPLLRG